MNAWQPNVVGKMYENHFQNSGNASVGHEKPVRKRHTGDITRNSRNTDSLLVMSELHAIENITQSVTEEQQEQQDFPELTPLRDAEQCRDYTAL